MSPQFLPITVTVRRFLALVLAAVLAASMLTLASTAPARAAPASTEIDNVLYVVDTAAPEAGATVRFGSGGSGGDRWSVVIPDRVQLEGIDYPVTAIGYGAFEGVGLRSVSLPDGLITIGDSAFADNYLTSLILPAGLVTIEQGAFDNNPLTSLTLPDSLKTIGTMAFWGNNLETVVIPAGVTTVGQQAFSGPLLSHVRFTGPAPALAEYALGWPGSGLVVTFPVQYQSQSPQHGYTTPEWYGHEAHPFYTVSFDTRGGADIEPVTVSRSEPVDVPAVPVREGFTFTGWYTTPELETVFEFQLPATENLTLYAGWQPNSVPVEPVTPGWGSLITGSLGSLALASAVS